VYFFPSTSTSIGTGGNTPGSEQDAIRMSTISFFAAFRSARSRDSHWVAMAPMSQVVNRRLSMLVVPTYSRRPLRCSAAIFSIISSVMPASTISRSGAVLATASRNGMVAQLR
jgi:hypothetical protein